MFVNRPALAHTIFRGRFAQFASRHHQQFLPIIVANFIGPLFWPYAYNDFLNYTAPTPSGFGYCVFGQVVEGMHIVDQIKGVPTGSKLGFKDVYHLQGGFKAWKDAGLPIQKS